MDKLTYEIQLFGEDSTETAAAAQKVAVPPAAENMQSEPEGGEASRESFEELIRGRYKEALDERVQKIIGGRLKKLREENDELQSRVYRQEERDHQAVEELVRSRDTIRALYPMYDPVQEAENPDFCRMVRAGVSPCAAYEAVHHKELMREAMQYGGYKPLRTEWWHFNLRTRAEAKARYKVIK